MLVVVQVFGGIRQTSSCPAPLVILWDHPLDIYPKTARSPATGRIEAKMKPLDLAADYSADSRVS